CGTPAGSVRVLRWLSWVGSESAISVHPLPLGVRVGNVELCQNLPLQSFHGFGVLVFFVIVADQMQETMDRQMAEMMIEPLLLVIGFPAAGFISNGDVAEHAGRVLRA